MSNVYIRPCTHMSNLHIRPATRALESPCCRQRIFSLLERTEACRAMALHWADSLPRILSIEQRQKWY